jgi:hypothetical protein
MEGSHMDALEEVGNLTLEDYNGASSGMAHHDEERDENSPPVHNV